MIFLFSLDFYFLFLFFYDVFVNFFSFSLFFHLIYFFNKYNHFDVVSVEIPTYKLFSLTNLRLDTPVQSVYNLLGQCDMWLSRLVMIKVSWVADAVLGFFFFVDKLFLYVYNFSNCIDKTDCGWSTKKVT